MPRRDGFGALRLLLALAVIAAHSRPLGFGLPNLGRSTAGGQTDLGTLAVSGFFVLSGLLITRSALHHGVGRFLWHRAVRILPGFWCCLLVTALIVAPLLAVHEGQDLTAWWSRPDGPQSYLAANWGVEIRQYGIGGLLSAVPYPSAFDGALWSLQYEVLAYLGVALLAGLGILRRARWLVLLLAGCGFALLAAQAWSCPALRAPTYDPHGTSFALPLLGSISTGPLIPLGFMFALGALAELYRARIPLTRLGAVAAAAAFLLSVRLGGFIVIGLPAFAYLLIWAAARMPAPLNRIGSKRDYSYGLYIYAFVCQQVLAEFGANRWGLLPYFALSVLCATGAAVLSWHLVEAPALRLKSVLDPRRNQRAIDPTGPAELPRRREPQESVPLRPGRPRAGGGG